MSDQMVILRSENTYNMKNIWTNLFCSKGPKCKFSFESGKLQYVNLWMWQICRQSEKKEILHTDELILLTIKTTKQVQLKTKLTQTQ